MHFTSPNPSDDGNDKQTTVTSNKNLQNQSRSGVSSRVNRRSLLQVISSVAIGAGFSGAATADGSGVASQASGTDGISVTRIDENEDKGFNFPYYLYAPRDCRDKPLLVETVNSGGCDDDFQVDLDAARRNAERGRARQVSDELRVPLIIPVFANPCEDDFWNRFIQSLDTETMHINSGKFERIDLQLLRMIEDAQERLADHGVEVPSKVMLNGFSASGNFVNNFTMLHPDRVASVSAGAVNGMATLPAKEYNGHTLNYQIGVADLEDLTGEPFDKEAWEEVPQLCYMGETEQSPNDDTLPYRDVWSEEQAEKAEAVYGEVMQTDRMTLSEMFYHEADATARFEVYDGVGHSYSDEILEDIYAFHARHNDIDIDLGDPQSGGGDSEESGEEDRTLSSCDDVETLEHEEVSVSFAERPTISSEEVAVETDVADSYGMRARTRLFPETGGGTWGYDLDWVPADESGTESYEVDQAAMTLGETLELTAFPEDWSTLDDAIASDCMVVSGVQFVEVPRAGDDELVFEYVYPEDAGQTGEILIEINGNRIDSITDIESGTFEKRTVDVPNEDGLPPEVDATLTLIDSERDVIIDERAVNSGPGDVAAVSFAAQPVAEGQSIALEYHLDAGYEVNRFATLRLYNSESSSWGIYIDKLEPGDNDKREFEITVDEPGIPLTEESELTVALVESDDPYARSPLATASTTVVSEDDTDQEEFKQADEDKENGDSEERDDEVDEEDYEDETDDGEGTDPEDDNDTAVDSDSDVTDSEGDGEGDSDETDSEGDDESDSSSDDESEATDDGSPGFGVGSALAGIGGLGYMLKRRLSKTGEESN